MILEKLKELGVVERGMCKMGLVRESLNSFILSGQGFCLLLFFSQAEKDFQTDEKVETIKIES